MEQEQAEQLLRQVCSQFKGTLQEHEAIQQALKTTFTKEE